MTYAESRSQAFYGSCLAEASDEYAQCRRESHAGAECRREYRHEKDRCWHAFTQMNSDPYYGWPGGGAARFEPAPIPQRPVYILPGMK